MNAILPCRVAVLCLTCICCPCLFSRLKIKRSQVHFGYRTVGGSERVYKIELNGEMRAAKVSSLLAESFVVNRNTASDVILYSNLQIAQGATDDSDRVITCFCQFRAHTHSGVAVGPHAPSH